LGPGLDITLDLTNVRFEMTRRHLIATISAAAALAAPAGAYAATSAEIFRDAADG